MARLRSAPAFETDNAVEHPTEVFGDLGAAHGAVMLALAAHAVAEGYRRAPCLVFVRPRRWLSKRPPEGHTAIARINDPWDAPFTTSEACWVKNISTSKWGLAYMRVVKEMAKGV